MVKASKLKSAELYQDQSDGPYFLMLKYEYIDKKGTHLLTFPKVEFPFMTHNFPEMHTIYGHLGNDMLSIDTIGECRMYSDSMTDVHGHMHRDICMLDELIEPVVKEMNVEEIEKALGYKIKIVGKE